MNQPQHLIVLEIRTMDNPGLDSSQLSTLKAFESSDGLYLGWDVKPLKSAILDAIVHLGSNYRHPLLYRVQVIPGDEADAIIASVPKRDKRQRRPR